MAETKVALELASFLDSEQAQALSTPTEDVRKIAEIFLRVCFDELGTRPEKLDGHDLHMALGHLMPAHFGIGDPLAQHAPAVLEAYIDHLAASNILSQSFELKQALAHTTEEFLHVVRTGQVVHHAPAKQEPIVNKAPKLGRNDPCSCGSGKKYKKCHGKR